MRMLTATLLLTLCTIGIDPDSVAVSKDLASVPLVDQPYTYYLTLNTQRSPQARTRLEKVLRSTLPSLSSKTYLPDQLPNNVGHGLLRIDTRGLGWEQTLPFVLKKHY